MLDVPIADVLYMFCLFQNGFAYAAGCSLMATLASGIASATPRDFAFRDSCVSDILAAVAIAGRFQVEVDPRVARSRLTVSVKQIEPLDALFALSRIEGWRVRRIPSPGGLKARYLVRSATPSERARASWGPRVCTATSEDIWGMFEAARLGKLKPSDSDSPPLDLSGI